MLVSSSKEAWTAFQRTFFWEDSQGSGRCSLTAASEYARVATTDERYAGWNILNRWRPRGDFSRMPAPPSPPTASQSRPGIPKDPHGALGGRSHLLRLQ